MAGYSGTPLPKKLGIKPGCVLYFQNAPAGYLDLLGPLPEGARIIVKLSEPADLIHLFSKDRAELEKLLPNFLRHIAQDGMIWVSWPKKSSGVPTTVTENIIRDIALPLGLVDIKVCAVDDLWSGLKLVIRRENRVGK
jgi:hypothetical protein